MQRNPHRCPSLLTSFFVIVAALFSCDNPPKDVLNQCSGELSLPLSVSTDILFVIDNSGSMQEEQAKVVANLEIFVNTLLQGPVHNDFQIGVVTTGVTMHYRAFCDPEAEPNFTEYPDQSGRLQQGKDLDGVVLDPLDRKILKSMDADLGDAFKKLVVQGTKGPGQEMGLEAAWLAVTKPLVDISTTADPPGNKGFLRKGSRLLVIIVSDEDDCSDPTGTAVALEPICGNECVDDVDCDDGYYCLTSTLGYRLCQRNNCETEEARALLKPVSNYVQSFKNMQDGLGRRREVFLGVIGAVDPDEPTVPTHCEGGGTESYGEAYRYAEAVSEMHPNSVIDSICDEDYAESLQKIAELVSAPQVIDLPYNPPDGRLLRIAITRESGETLECLYDEGFLFEPASGDAPARVTMLESCRLRNGDEIHWEVFCAG